MAGPMSLLDSQLLKAMHDGFDNHIREQLRKRIMEIMKPDIDAAVEAAMKTFESTLLRHYDQLEQQAILKIVLEDKRT